MHKAMALTLSMLMPFLTLSLHVNAIFSPPPPPLPRPGNQLHPTYYDGLCITADGTPGTKKFQDLTDSIVKAAVLLDSTLIPALLRMTFHDGFVLGSDASILLNSTSGNVAEKDGPPNQNSLRGYEVIDTVKTAVEAVCGGIISCADILQEVARAALKHLILGSLEYNLRYGRRDGRISLASEAAKLPAPHFKYTDLVSDFAAKGFSPFELMILSGAHTFGFSRCSSFSSRLYNFTGNGSGTDPALNPAFAEALKVRCPPGKLDGAVELDYKTPVTFDNQYYQNIKDGKALFTSDNELKVDPTAPPLPSDPSQNDYFRDEFKKAIVKLSEVEVKLYPDGEIRTSCAFRK